MGSSVRTRGALGTKRKLDHVEKLVRFRTWDCLEKKKRSHFGFFLALGSCHARGSVVRVVRVAPGGVADSEPFDDFLPDKSLQREK